MMAWNLQLSAVRLPAHAPGPSHAHQWHAGKSRKYLSPSQMIFLNTLEQQNSAGEGEKGDLSGFKPNWNVFSILVDDARILQAQLNMCPRQAW
jgi:hypothetical protein